MKKLKFLTMALASLFLTFGQTSCSSDDPTPPQEKPEPTPEPTPDTPDNPDDPQETQNYHFDLWVALDKHGGMARDVQTLVRSLDNLDADQPQINFEGTGVEINSVLTLETIQKGAYYYQVPVSGDCFGKYAIENNKIEVIAERRFKDNTFSARKYTHAWVSDNTLVIMAAGGDGDKILWTKLNADDMTIIAEGTLGVTMPEGGEAYTTSGILTYRPSDNKLFYFYYAKTAGRRGVRVTPMITAVINPETMAVESATPCFLDCEMVGTAYGELLQTTTFLDSDNNLYIACVTDDEEGNEHSHLLKIPAGSTSFDQAYDGYTAPGKLISVMYIGENKIMAYAREDQLGTNIDDFSHYYTVIDVVTKESEPVAFEGKRLDYCSGRFSSRMATVDGKAYIGVDAENTNPKIYIYNVADGSTTKGAEIAPGYFFEQIRVVENRE